MPLFCELNKKNEFLDLFLGIIYGEEFDNPLIYALIANLHKFISHKILIINYDSTIFRVEYMGIFDSTNFIYLFKFTISESENESFEGLVFYSKICLHMDLPFLFQIVENPSEEEKKDEENSDYETISMSEFLKSMENYDGRERLESVI
jgi:hypothetical protein